ncbi:MAG: hypothetical protein QXD15_04480, partial [Thermoplasmata archaeon]
STFEVAHYFENGFIRFYGETDPLKPDTDGDCCLDGYEVLYATKEPYDRYWEPRKGGILHLLNPADPEDGARDVDIFEEEVAETRVGGGLDPPIEPSFVNFTINDTIPARAVVFDFAHVVELQRMSFSASSNSSRLAVLLYAGEFPDGCLVDERTIPVNTTMGNLSIDYSGFYLDRGYFVFRRAYPTDTAAFIGGLKFAGTPDPEIPQAQNFKYYQEGWQNLPLNQVYNFSLGNIPLNLQILSIDQHIQGWAVLIENPSAQLISSIGIGLRPDDARAGDFVLEVREYGENVSVMDTPLLFTKRSALNGEGWYRVDIPDISLQNFYVVLRYAGERFYWKASFGEKLRHAFLLTNEGREFPVDINPCIKLYTYSGLSSNSARHGDGANNSLEGIAGTNPLSENTDAFYSGCIFYDDSLNDSEELSMVVFRTNAVQGALTAANYREGVWVELRAEGLNGFTAVSTAVRYTYRISSEVNIPAGTTLYKEYFRLYRLPDGSEFYRAPSGTHLILFSPALPAEINQSYSGMCYLFALEPGATPTLALDPRPHPEYRDGELYVSSPFDIDTDDDGLRDGNEPFWNLDLESPNPYGVTDLLPGAHDPDSDGDGIMDSLEVDYLKDTDLDGFVNMVDADSDNDGVVDGKEVCWNLDTDGDGNANMVDNDADNDGLSDGIELNPYLAAQALQLTMNYEIYVDGCGIEFSKIFWFDFCADRLYVGYKDNGVEKIAEGKFERYRKEQYLHSLTIDITGQVFAVNHTGAIFTVSGGNLVGYVRKPDGSYEGRTIVRNVPPIRSIAVNLTTVFFATQQKVYAVPSHMENLLLENAQIISDSAFNAVTANENGCYLAGESLIQMPDGCSINTPSSEKKGVCVLRDGSVVWATDSAIFLAQPPYSRFHSGLNTYTEVKSTEVKCLKSDAKDNIFILNDAAFVMIKYARTDMIASDTDGDGLWDGYDLGGHKGELSERVCQAVEVKTSSPKYAGYLENREIPLAPYVHAYAGFTDPTEVDSDGDGLSDLEEIEGWEIQVRDCALLVANSLDPLAAFTIPSSKPWYTINSYGDAEILSEAETVHTVHVNSNPLFTDTDCDGLSDSQESGFTNPLDPDSDNDGLTDAFELGEDGVLGEGETNPVVRDTDGDGLPDGWLEIATNNTLANKWGFSAIAPLWKDGINFGEGNWDVELKYYQGIGWRWEKGKEVGECVGSWDFVDGVYKISSLVRITEPLLVDTDRDGVEDGTEFLYLLTLKKTPYWNSMRKWCEFPYDCWQGSPHIPDVRSYDSDNDGLGDGEENWVLVEDTRTGRFVRNTVLDIDETNNTHLETDPTDPDCDDDGLLDGQEFEWRNNTDYDPNLLGCWDDINAWDKDINDNGGCLKIENTTNLNCEQNNTVVVTLTSNILPYSTVYVNLYYVRTGGVEMNRSYSGIITFAGKKIWVEKPSYVVALKNATVRYYTGSGNSNYHDFSETYCVFRTNARYDEGAKRLIYTSDSWVVVPLLSANGGYPSLTDTTRGNFTFCSIESELPQEAKKLQVYYGSTTAQVHAPDGANVSMAISDESSTRLPNQNTRTYYLYIETKVGDTTKYLKFTLRLITTDSTTAHSQNEFWQNHQETLDYRACSNLDSDFDGLSNHVEVLLGTDPNDGDTDDDGLSDGDEVQKYGTDAKNWDSDGDSLPDGLELGVTVPLPDTEQTPSPGPKHFIPDADPTTKTDPLNSDTDADRIPDGMEDLSYNGMVDPGETDPLDADTDDDGLIDSSECPVSQGGTGTSPLNPDTDADGLPDGLELGLTYGMLTPDTDLSRGNFISDADEGRSKTLPTRADSDEDGIKDGEEDSNHDGAVSENETDPNQADTDGDGLSDKEELSLKTNPLCRDSDNDGLTDGTEVKRTEQVGIP